MSTRDPVWLTEADVVALLDLSNAMTAIEAALRAEAAHDAFPLTKTHAEFGHGHGLHALGGVWQGAVAGTKTWAHTGGGAAPLLLLFDTTDGSVVAVIEAFALGQLRTGAISGIATGVLARRDATVLGLVGAGKQAIAQVAAVVAACPIEAVRVASIRPESRATLARRIEDELGVPAIPVESVADAAAGADVVTLVTRATEPFLASEHLQPGTHVNAVGAITLDRREFDPAILDRCRVVTSDSVPQARALSRELLDRYGDDATAWEAVTPLAELLAGGAPRPTDADLTLFKATGTGLADVALGMACVERAAAMGIGRAFNRAERVPPRLRTRQVATGCAR